MPIDINKYNQWLEATYELKRFKKEELSLRKEIIESHGDDHTFEGKEKETVENFELEYGYGLTRSLDRPALDMIWDELSDEEKNCIDWAPKIKLKELKSLEALGPDSKLLDCITTKPSLSTLKITDINYE